MPTDKDKQIESEDFEERCAIREYLGNVPRDQAERETREEFIKRAQRQAIKSATQYPQGGLF
jgi:hypothetical protein